MPKDQEEHLHFTNRMEHETYRNSLALDRVHPFCSVRSVFPLNLGFPLTSRIRL